jgi:pimeloyl-ACP methyl ester carboxylesterase
MDVQIVGQGRMTVVALHGIQGTRAAWQPVARQLASKARFVLPNLRGRGAALRAAGPAGYSLEAYASDAGEVIDRHVGQAPFVLAGWSMGVSVALELLQRRPDLRPQGLILLSGTPCLRLASWFTGEGAQLTAEVAARERRLGLVEAADHDAVAWTWAAIRATDQRPLLQRIDVPALVLHGSADEDSPWLHGRWLAKGLPRATLVTLPDAGHSLLSAATGTVTQEIEQFIARVSRPEETT